MKTQVTFRIPFVNPSSITGRDGYIELQALAYAIVAIELRPTRYQSGATGRTWCSSSSTSVPTRKRGQLCSMEPEHTSRGLVIQQPLSCDIWASRTNTRRLSYR
jgi:hypothetical protein